MESIETELVDDGGKRDVRGRRIIKAAERERLIAAYENSGLTQKAFCEREGINRHTFISWLGKKRAGGGESRPEVFQEVLLAAGPDPGPGPGSDFRVEVQLGSGEIVRGSDAGAVAKVVRLLRS